MELCIPIALGNWSKLVPKWKKNVSKEAKHFFYNTYVFFETHARWRNGTHACKHTQAHTHTRKHISSSCSPPEWNSRVALFAEKTGKHLNLSNLSNSIKSNFIIFMVSFHNNSKETTQLGPRTLCLSQSWVQDGSPQPQLLLDVCNGYNYNRPRISPLQDSSIKLIKIAYAITIPKVSLWIRFNYNI